MDDSDIGYRRVLICVLLNTNSYSRLPHCPHGF